MKTVPQLLLSFLINAGWQVAVIALAGVFADRLLRSVVRLRHAIWVAAVLMSVLLPLFSSLPALPLHPALPTPIETGPQPIVDLSSSNVPESSPALTDSSLHLALRTAAILIGIYLLIVLYRAARLVQAWIRTREARRDARQIELPDEVRAIVEHCQQVFGVKCQVLGSSSLRAPVTLGALRPLVILPEVFLRGDDLNALTAAIGHEVVHVARRDYLLNLIYEVLFLPLSFHPAAALIKRRLIQTRELRCDELVAERLLHADVYARSLVRIAGWAMPFNRPAQTIVVGITDADILEVRIMSLLKKTSSNLRRNVLLALGALMLLAIPCVAAASFGFNFSIEPTVVQDPETQEKKELRARQEREGAEMKRKIERQEQELKQAIEQASNPADRAKYEAMLKKLHEEQQAFAVTMNGENYKFLIDEEGQRRERELQEKRKSELAKIAKISMDQAIQIANSSTPGKVLECSLVGEHWSGPEELAKPSLVLYHVVILSGDDARPETTHVLVNAVDGTIFRTSKEKRGEEMPRKLKSELFMNGGILNARAISLPVPQYPETARQAQITGTVSVAVLVDESGSVIEAKAVSGHPLLQAVAVDAARQAKFDPTTYNGELVKFKGTITYSFVAR